MRKVTLLLLAVLFTLTVFASSARAQWATPPPLPKWGDYAATVGTYRHRDDAQSQTTGGLDDSLLVTRRIS